MKLFRIFNTFVVSAFAVVAFSSCSGNETDYALDVAENLIWTRPDSSLSVLGSVDTLRLRPESSRARFSLLYAMALDRNCIDTADISVLSLAVRYYDRHGSDTDRMMSYYYLGRLYYNTIMETIISPRSNAICRRRNIQCVLSILSSEA